MIMDHLVKIISELLEKEHIKKLVEPHLKGSDSGSAFEVYKRMISARLSQFSL